MNYGVNMNKPDNANDWRVDYWSKPIPTTAHDWEITHKDYNPPDSRHFTGPTEADVWQQAKDYEDETK